jgi:hypothetical protein
MRCESSHITPVPAVLAATAPQVAQPATLVAAAIAKNALDDPSRTPKVAEVDR